MVIQDYLKHQKKESNRSAIQIFTKYGPLAFLPVSREKTSVVFSIFEKKLNLKTWKKKEILKFNKKYNIKIK